MCWTWVKVEATSPTNPPASSTQTNVEAMTKPHRIVNFRKDTPFTYCVCAQACAGHGAREQVRERLLGVLLSFLLWVSGIKLGSAGPEASAFTH